MTPLWALFTFVNLWCVSLFAVLSLGNTHERTVSENDYAAAPDRPNFRKKFIITTIVAASLTTLIAVLMNMGIISLI